MLSDQDKPCPFCGSKDVAVINQYIAYVRYWNCGAKGPVAPNNKEQEAIKRWNNRVNPNKKYV